MSSKQIFCFDATIKNNEYTNDFVEIFFKRFCKKYVFQNEIGALKGYNHFQCRGNLKDKTTLNKINNYFIEYFGKGWGKASLTSTANSKGESFYTYCEKEDTKVGVSVRDDTEVIYIPRQIREIETLREWQQTIVEKLKDWDTRTINILYCENGNIGKSILVGWIRANKLGRALPPVNDNKDLLRMVYCLDTSNAYLFDMPRSQNKDRLYQFYSAVETIKDGYAYDDRYHFKDKNFDCPNIWIFTNSYPDLDMLSKDRWKIWEVENNRLVEFLAEDEEILIE
ncbi:MAG: replication protein [Cressdnaviricota sp.]|nr:MAG: replication protein [Cressdnaviricota sp.]